LIGLSKPTSHVYLNKKLIDKVHPACAFHKGTMSLYVIGGLRAGKWTTSASCYDIKSGLTKRSLADIQVALIGPNATVVDPENSPAHIVVSG
jgi:hypothetical protein